MSANDRFAEKFDVHYNKRVFKCLFIADDLEKTLFLSTTGKKSFVISFSIDNNFECTPYINEHYNELCDYLGLTYNPSNPFSPKSFLLQLDKCFPTVISKSPSVSERAAFINRSSNTENKPYFVGWIKWNVRQTSYENMLLTASIVGYKNAKRLMNMNISSAWSSNPNDERLDLLDDWVKYIDI